MTVQPRRDVSAVVSVAACGCGDCDGAAVTLTLRWCEWPDGRRAEFYLDQKWDGHPELHSWIQLSGNDPLALAWKLLEVKTP